MADILSPAVLRRRLMIELRSARAATSLTQKQVAKELDWSPSKLLRIENGSVSVSTTDLHALLRHYGIRDRHRIDELVKLAQGARQQSPNAHRDVMSAETLRFLELRSGAIRIRQFEPLYVPGLLQIEEYAQALHRTFARPEDSDEIVNRRVAARMEQKDEIFERKQPPEMFFVLDEAAVRRWVGGPRVMRRQLEELKRLVQHPQVTLQVVPFSAGAHRGMLGPFQIVEFEPSEDYLLYLENARGDIVTREDREETTRYVETFFRLEDVAMKPWDVERFVDQLINEIDLATNDSDPVNEEKTVP
ncbi:MAG: helix-turn-helix domain-containing protein [Dactylosporangium sp.]|nr:helix-turn-helix domain-containing protein [Dactylosporangium sp.]